MSQATHSSQDQRLAASDERRRAPCAQQGCTTIIPLPCLPEPDATRCRRRMRTPARGFTLIEMLVAMAVAGILSSVAYPSFQSQVQKVRRSDVLVAMMKVQLAQERWRSNNNGYGSLVEVGVSNRSAAGYYMLQVTSNTGEGYEVLATATGTQARDAQCRNLKLSVVGANLTYRSGPDASTGNAPAVNRQCWNL